MLASHDSPSSTPRKRSRADTCDSEVEEAMEVDDSTGIQILA
jgi:hypothetical protein